MHTQKKYIVTVVVLAVIAIGVVSAYIIPVQTTLTNIPITLEEQERNNALGVAQRYVVTSPTFAFDGDVNTLDTEYVASDETSFPIQYIFTIAFDSAHSGYGDREGQVLTQAITHHKMDIIVSEDNVISAITDRVWDEINHQYVLKQKLPSSNESIIDFDGKVTDFQTLVSALKARGLEVHQTEEIDDSAFAVPIKVISVAEIHLQVYEFDSESDANSARETISPDGTEIGLSIIRWMDVPHFYSQGKIIVQYIGHNPEMLNILESLLGNQFAGM